MPFDSILLLAGILLAAFWTPGPNNAMLAASAATFGFRRTVPHILGVSLGFACMIFMVSLGLGQLFEQSAFLREGLRITGIVLLLWVAWKIATMKAPGTAGAKEKPFTWWQAAGFQWINPKAWMMCISVSAQFATGDAVLLKAAIIWAVSATLGTTSACGWAGFGAAMQRVLARPAALRAFNLFMAALILLGVAVLVRAAL